MKTYQAAEYDETLINNLKEIKISLNTALKNGNNCKIYK